MWARTAGLHPLCRDGQRGTNDLLHLWFLGRCAIVSTSHEGETGVDVFFWRYKTRLWSLWSRLIRLLHIKQRGLTTNVRNERISHSTKADVAACNKDKAEDSTEPRGASTLTIKYK
ncbi:hypothetical protein GDO81_028440 [Engystomops pustulosus]|uniref:Uncharacterized protein n=1 Tax=Engystomops pustulosus TaxID=76066 RepID=A0AAV6YDT7_ENGPU|nr:hypothetical protein GDO81_028440 [Engystomops pustulosus]